MTSEAQKVPAAARWLMPSIADLVFLGVFCLLLIIGSGLLNDGDTSWHILTGESILDTHEIPFSDPYSHTMPGTPWTSHEWLAAVIFAVFHRLAGLSGVVVFTAAIIALSFFFLYKFMLYRGVNPMIALLFTAMTAVSSMLHWLARPHAFSFLLTLGFIVILEVHQREGKNRLHFLPLLMIPWVNLHGGFILGIMLLMIYWGGNLVLMLALPERRGPHTRKFKALSAALAATMAATLVNPHGASILYFPFHLVGRQFIMDNIQEWLSPNFHETRMFEALLVTVVAIFALSKKKPDIFEGAAALMLVHMSFYSARYIPLFGLIVVPMAAVRAGGVLDGMTAWMRPSSLPGRVRDRLARISRGMAPLEKRLNRHLLVIAAIAYAMYTVIGAGPNAASGRLHFEHNPDRFPVRALEFALENDIPGKMFNNDGWGGYIIYKSFPRYRVFFDGRSDMYGVDFLREFIKISRAEPGFEGILDRYDVNWVMFNANSNLCRLLAAGGGWRLIYADDKANILVRDAALNWELIERYRYARFLPDAE